MTDTLAALLAAPPESVVEQDPATIARQRERLSRRRRRHADLLSVLAWASAAAAAALYLAEGGLRGIHDLAGVIQAAGILTGLIGTDLILVMLLLAARVPLIDRTFGQDKAMALHRRLGKPALYLLLAHGGLLLGASALLDGVDPVAEALLLFSGIDMLLALLGMILMVAVVVTSLVAIRRRFAYEAWHVIHLLSYAAVLVAVPHQLSAGQVLAEGTGQRIYWISLYVLAFAAIGWYRFFVPLRASLRHGLRVSAVEEVASGVVSIHLSGRDLERLGVIGGQYAIWRFWTGSTWWHAHPISFSAVPTDGTARITVRELGRGTARLAKLRPGTRVSLEGPYGIFTPVTRTAPRLAVIAAGIGVTPVRALLESSAPRPDEVTALLRAPREHESYLWSEIAHLVERSGGRSYGMVGSRPAGLQTWMSAESLERGVTLTSVFPDLLDSDLYVCGPTAWADLVIRDARAAGLADEHIHIERFDW